MKAVDGPHSADLSRCTSSSSGLSDTATLIGMAIATLAVHMLTGNRYGFHRDELATLQDARYLAWGYVAYPPLTPFFARLSLILFGTSLAGFRFFAATAQAIAVILTGMMARELGSRGGAQLLAGAAAIPFCLASGTLMQYVAFDCLWWVAVSYFVIRLLRTQSPRGWIWVGAAFGLGMMTKYGVVFLVPGVLVGFFVTPARRLLFSKWFLFAIALAFVIFLPNLIWQVRHGFISLEFLQHIHARDVRIGRTKNFLPDQLELTFLAAPLALAGLWWYLCFPNGSRYRALGWMYVIPLLLFVIAQGRGYYLAGAYPMLYAAGSVWFEEWAGSLGRVWASAVRSVVWIALVANVAFFSVVVLPLSPVNSPLFRFASKKNGDLVEELGWPELVAEVARIRDGLPAEEHARLGILTANYGEAGAIDLYGRHYGLPPAISGVNSYWQKGYGNPAPETLIVLGFPRRFLDEQLASCDVAGQTPNPYLIENEETRDHPDIFVCRTPRRPWPEFWRGLRRFG